MKVVIWRYWLATSYIVCSCCFMFYYKTLLHKTFICNCNPKEDKYSSFLPFFFFVLYFLLCCIEIENGVVRHKQDATSEVFGICFLISRWCNQCGSYACTTYVSHLTDIQLCMYCTAHEHTLYLYVSQICLATSPS